MVDGEGAVRYLDSLSEGRALFGREQVYFYKVQAGIAVPTSKPDWSMRLSPTAAQIAGKLFDCVEVLQTFDLSFPFIGYLRKVRVRNSGASPMRLRLVGLSDPAAAHFMDGPDRWGSLGVNAFNRESHVAMDEISEPHRARVIGSIPTPARFYMTTEKARVAELLQEGDFPEQTAGMSGQVLVLSIHELELAPSDSREVLFASFYSASKLEDVLSEFGRLQSAGRTPHRRETPMACSSPRVAEAFGWALASVEGAQFEKDILERLEAIRGLEYLHPEAVEATVARTRDQLRKDGLLGHTDDWTKIGVLESSLLLSGISHHLVLSNDRKGARPFYAFLKRMANALLAQSNEGVIQLDRTLPQGWRRLVRSGYPSGEVPEVSLAASAALSGFSRVSRLLGKGEEAAKFREMSELIAQSVGKRLVDSRGFLALGVDSFGKLRAEETVDMAVACYRSLALRSVASSGVHRLLEEDFETGYGPRTVPVSNRMYFHGSHGQGQLGGYWTRAALALVCLSYATGLSGMGSLLLEKASALVAEDTLEFGGVPGEFPYWVDIERKEAHGTRSDPVSASRYVQAVVEGELGFAASATIPAFNPPALSTIKWVLARDLWVGERASIFVGRAAGKVAAFANCQHAELKEGQRFGGCGEVEVSTHGADAISFYGPGQVICVGNSTSAPTRAHVAFSGKTSGLAKKLSTPLEEFELQGRTWNKIGSLRVSPTMAFDAPLGPAEWKVYRVSND